MVGPFKNADRDASVGTLGVCPLPLLYNMDASGSQHPDRDRFGARSAGSG
jgi:hypothetical protein